MTHSKEGAEFTDGMTLKPGYLVRWQGDTYRIVSIDPNDISVIQAESIARSDAVTLYLDELLAPSDDGAPTIFAATEKALRAEIERRQPPPEPAPLSGLRDNPLKKAAQIIFVVETVERFIAEWLRRCVRDGIKFHRTEALTEALKELNTMDQMREWDLAISRPGTYYDYLKRYNKHQGDLARIAASFRRSTLNQTGVPKAVLHFVDTIILRYGTRAKGQGPRLRPKSLYRMAEQKLKRTGRSLGGQAPAKGYNGQATSVVQGYWIDPEKCKGDIPENVKNELLDPKIPVDSILANPEKMCLLTPITLPKKTWFYAYLSWFRSQPGMGKALVDAQYGTGAWDRELAIWDTFVTQVTMPLQVVLADHCLLKIFVVDDDTRSRVDRLWLTVLIDAYTRCILGIVLLYESPCIESIMSALRHAIWPKNQELAREGIPQKWSCFGIPLLLSLDNAWAHHSITLENAARLIGQNGKYSSIQLHWRPPYKARYGALIERYLGNITGKIKELLPGAILSNDPEHVRNAAKEACLLYQDLYRVILQLIVDYQHTPHSELDNMTPDEKWREWVQQHGLPQVPPLAREVERLFWRLDPGTRVITNKGISAFGMHYWSPALAHAQRIDLNGKKTKYGFGYDPSDISRLGIYRNGEWVGDVESKELRRPDGSVRPVSLWERKMARDMAQDAGRVAQDWQDFIDEVSDLSRRRQAEKRMADKESKRKRPPRKPAADVQAIEQALTLIPTAESDERDTKSLVSFLN